MKIFITAIVGILILIFGGVFLMTKDNTKPTEVSIPQDSHQTSPGATVTLLEFGDYQCPACGSYNPIIKELVKEFGDKLNFVFRDFPLSQHKNANISAYAANAAGLQGKFWEMHDKIYETQSAWSDSTDAKSIFVGYAKDLGLDVNKFKTDIDSSAINEKVQKDLVDGNLAGVDSTPTFFLNGEKLKNPGSLEDFKTLIKGGLIVFPEDYHAHFDLKVYVNGKAVDLGLSESDLDIHIHEEDGKVVHVHKMGITLKEIFDSMKLTLPNQGYVNGKLINVVDYIPQDLDRILIGSSNLNSVTDEACIYSEKCPERGSPPEEECVGGLGTNCEK